MACTCAVPCPTVPTVVVPPPTAAVGNDGELQGVGMLIASDPSSGRTVVLAPIKGSPAEQAGIQPGDEVRKGGYCRGS